MRPVHDDAAAAGAHARRAQAAADARHRRRPRAAQVSRHQSVNSFFPLLITKNKTFLMLTIQNSAPAF